PAMDRTLARSAKLHRASARELARTARALEADVAGQCRGTLSRLRLATLDPAQAALVLRHWLAKRGLRALPARRLEGLVSALRGSAGSPTCAIDGMQVRCYRDDVFVVAPRQSRSTPPGDWAPPESLELANGTLLATAAVGAGVARKWFDSGEVSVAYRVAGDRCVMHDGVRHQSMKKLFQTHGVPPWNRDFWPLLKAGDAVIAVPGIYVSQTYMAGPDELGWILEWQWH
ncbi:MAG: tRNA lysidine(34) synthetase TilS, partial [Pseudomonadota bacterium]